MATTISLTRNAVNEAAALAVPTIDLILLVGGSSRMPQVQARLKAEFPGVEQNLFDPELAVAKGAAIYASSTRIQETVADLLEQTYGRRDVNLEALPANVQTQIEAQVARALPGTSRKAISAGLRTRVVNVCSKNFGIVVKNTVTREDEVVYLDQAQQPGTDRGRGPVWHARSESGRGADPCHRIERRGGTGQADLDPRQRPGLPRDQADNAQPAAGLPAGHPIKVKYSLSEDGGRLARSRRGPQVRQRNRGHRGKPQRHPAAGAGADAPGACPGHLPVTDRCRQGGISMGTFIGIDLGTTFSAAASIGADGRPVIIPNAEGAAHYAVGDLVRQRHADSRPVGQGRAAHGAEDIAAFFKRSMGDPNYLLSFHGKDYTPVDLSALVLRKIKSDCEVALGEQVSHAVITVPAYFNNAQRQATIEAGRRAGLGVLRIINEPMAAALAYGVQQTDKTETALVYDLGGGTFDITLVRITPEEITVLATDGDHELGGKDWDDRIARFLATRFRDEHGLDPLENTLAFQDVLVRCEQAKQQLSNRSSLPVSIDYAGIRGTYVLTREKFEELTLDLLERTRELTEQVLRDAHVSWSDVSFVLLVGGSTRMPMVRTYAERMSGKPPRSGVNVDEAVALGAAVQAAMDMRTDGTPGGAAPGGGPQDPGRHEPQPGCGRRGPRSVSLYQQHYSPQEPADSGVDEATVPAPHRARGDNVLEVYLTQGESDVPTKCTILGKYVFSGISHVAGSGPAVLEINYVYDANGVVAASATERSTGKQLTMRVELVPSDIAWLDQRPQRTTASCT